AHPAGRDRAREAGREHRHPRHARRHAAARAHGARQPARLRLHPADRRRDPPCERGAARRLGARRDRDRAPRHDVGRRPRPQLRDARRRARPRAAGARAPHHPAARGRVRRRHRGRGRRPGAARRRAARRERRRLTHVNESTETRYGRTATVTGTRTRGATLTRYATERTGFAASVDEGRRAASRVAKALRATAQWLGETVSPAGWLLFGAAAAGLAAALAWHWAEAWVVAAIALVLLVACVPFLLGRHDYAIRLVLDRDRVVAGSEITGELDVANRGARASLPVLLDIPVGEGLVEAHIPLLRAGAQHREQITISAARRGVIPVGPMTISRGDPLGILRREQAWPEVQTIYVHPVTTPIPSTSAGFLRDLEGATTTT